MKKKRKKGAFDEVENYLTLIYAACIYTKLLVYKMPGSKVSVLLNV